MKNLKLSFAITVCNEFVEIQRLLPFLLKYKRQCDEIVVLVDMTKNEPTSELLGYLHKLSSNDHITLVEDEFNNDFAQWKNRLTRACKGDFVFQIDADELVTRDFLAILPTIIVNNDVDVILVPRVNTVSGLTQDHITKWGWNVDGRGWVNFPDYQWRIYRNHSDIKWVSKVHEVLSGYNKFSHLPADPEYALIHNKTIEKQEKQNQYYDTI